MLHGATFNISSLLNAWPLGEKEPLICSHLELSATIFFNPYYRHTLWIIDKRPGLLSQKVLKRSNLLV